LINENPGDILIFKLIGSTFKVQR